MDELFDDGRIVVLEIDNTGLCLLENYQNRTNKVWYTGHQCKIPSDDEGGRHERDFSHLEVTINCGSKRLGLNCDDVAMNLENLSVTLDGEVRVASRLEYPTKHETEAYQGVSRLTRHSEKLDLEQDRDFCLGQGVDEPC